MDLLKCTCSPRLYRVGRLSESEFIELMNLQNEKYRDNVNGKRQVDL